MEKVEKWKSKNEGQLAEAMGNAPAVNCCRQGPGRSVTRERPDSHLTVDVLGEWFDTQPEQGRSQLATEPAEGDVYT